MMEKPGLLQVVVYFPNVLEHQKLFVILPLKLTPSSLSKKWGS
jgi:hypothetical protein